MGGGRNNRYPLLPTVFRQVYPNPPPVTGYDDSCPQPNPPLPAKSDSNVLAGVAAKLENSSSGPAYEASLSQLRRCAWLAAKESNADWAKLRRDLGKAGSDYKTLDQIDPRVDTLSYGAAPTLMSKYGF